MFRCRPACRLPTSTTTSFPGVTQHTTSQASASGSVPARQSSSWASASATASRGSWHTPARSRPPPGSAPPTCRAARSPRSPPSRASERASAAAATAATAPVRSAVTERASSSISGSPVSASDRQITPVTVGSPRSGLPGERGHPFQQRQSVPERRHGTEIAERRALQIHLRRHRPVAGVEAQQRLAHPLDRHPRRDGLQHGVVVEDGKLGHVRHDTLTQAMNRRPKLTIVAPTASDEEAAAVVAALERFMRETAPPPAPPAATAATVAASRAPGGRQPGSGRACAVGLT